MVVSSSRIKQTTRYAGEGLREYPSGIQSEEVGAVPTLRSMSVKGDEMILRTQNLLGLGVYRV